MTPNELKRRRKAAGLKQDDLAELCEAIDQPAISRMERGKEPIGPKRKVMLGRALRRGEQKARMRAAVKRAFRNMGWPAQDAENHI